MNQSIEANSFEKSLLEKCTDDWQQESANELWKGSFSSVCSQNGAQNTNQAYENLLRICEEIDTALPEIRSTVNKKGELEINEQNSLKDKSVKDLFDADAAFGDIGTSLEDIEIYEDILNASAMMDNDDCIYNQNFDIMKTNQFLQSDAFNDFLTLPFPDSMQRVPNKNKNQSGPISTSIFDRAPIFGDDEIDQYMVTKNFNLNEPFGIPTKSNQNDDSVDPLQFWHKLNCPTLPDLCPTRCPPCPSPVESDHSESKKSTKSVLAILDFTLPSLSSSTSSCALSSPVSDLANFAERKDTDESKPEESLPTQGSNGSKKSFQLGLPVLIAEPDVEADRTKTQVKKKKKKPKPNKNNTSELQRDLVLSSPSGSSLSSVSDIKPLKKRKLNPEPPIDQKSASVNQPKHSDPKPSSKNAPKPKSVPKPTSPTLKAGAIYIEQQLSKPRKPEQNRTPDKRPKHVKEITPKTPSKQDPKPNSSTPKSTKSKTKSKDKNQPASPASMPPLITDSPPPILLARIKKDENNKPKPVQHTPGAQPAIVKHKSKNHNGDLMSAVSKNSTRSSTK